MNPIIIKIGPLEIHAFTGWIGAGVAIGIGIALGMALFRRQPITRWLDPLVASVVGGVIGARALHVWLHWDYFSQHVDKIIDLRNGGLDWHGAVIFGSISLVVTAWLRQVAVTALTGALAPAFPIGAIMGWLASRSANAAYGVEVPTLADYPSWLVSESADIYGKIVPRINLLTVGIGLALLVLAITLILMVFKKFGGGRLWFGIALFSLGMGIVDFFRGEAVPMWFGRRADQILDFAVAVMAIIFFAVSVVVSRHNSARSAGLDSDSRDTADTPDNIKTASQRV